MITIEDVIDYLEQKNEEYSEEMGVYGDEFLVGYDQAIRDMVELVDEMDY